MTPTPRGRGVDTPDGIGEERGDRLHYLLNERESLARRIGELRNRATLLDAAIDLELICQSGGDWRACLRRRRAT